MHHNSPKSVRGRLLPLALVTTSVAILLGCGATPTVVHEVLAIPTVAATREAVAALPSPTATARPTSTQVPTATVTMTPSPTPIPPEIGSSPGLEGLGAAAADYLNRSGGNVAALKAALGKWGLIASNEGGMAPLMVQSLGPITTADLSGQGTDDIIIAGMDTQAGGTLAPGTLLVLHKKGGSYSVAFDSAAAGQTRGPVGIVSTEDLTGDSRPDVTYTIQSCGASTCFAELHLLTCQDAAYTDIADAIAVAFPDRIEVVPSAGAQAQLIVHGNTYGSVGAGPQRASTLTYRVQDGRLRLAQVSYDASDLLYFKVVDANAALAAGRLDDAINLYNQAVNDRSLKASAMMMNGMDAQQEIEALRSFARFRLVVAHVLHGDDAAAARTMSEVQSAGGPFAPVAAAFWSAYSQSRSLDQGCTAVQATVEANADLLGILNAFGYANPEFTAQDVCRGAGTTPQM